MNIYIYIPFLGPGLGLDLVQGLGPADAAIARAHAAAATAGTYVGNSVSSIVGRMQSSKDFQCPAFEYDGK